MSEVKAVVAVMIPVLMLMLMLMPSSVQAARDLPLTFEEAVWKGSVSEIPSLTVSTQSETKCACLQGVQPSALSIAAAMLSIERYNIPCVVWVR